MSHNNEEPGNETGILPPDWELINTTISFSAEDVKKAHEACAADRDEIKRYVGLLPIVQHCLRS